MGNNHEKFYGSNQRKIILLGPAASGKTTLYRLMLGESINEI